MLSSETQMEDARTSAEKELKIPTTLGPSAKELNFTLAACLRGTLAQGSPEQFPELYGPEYSCLGSFLGLFSGLS